MGNSLPILHAHIVPRYLSEMEELRKGGYWSYPQEQIHRIRFDAVHDRELMQQLEQAIRKRV